MFIPLYLGRVKDLETELTDAFTLVADRHSRDAEVRDMCLQLARWSHAKVHALQSLGGPHARLPTEHAARLRSAVLYGTRMGGLGQVQDLEDLGVLVTAAELAWTALGQAAKEAKDSELAHFCDEHGTTTKRQLEWVKTRLKHVAPQALAVRPRMRDEVKASLPRYPSVAAIPEPVWVTLGAMLMLLVVGGIGMALGLPLLVASIGPSVALHVANPAHPAARLYNVVGGHLAGIMGGVLGLWLMGAWNEPSPMLTGAMTAARLGAVVVGVGVTLLLGQLLHAAHPPAAATTMLVSLGVMQQPRQMLTIAVAAFVVGVLGEALRRVRLDQILSRTADMPHLPKAAWKG